jgi:hypothetical protein
MLNIASWNRRFKYLPLLIAFGFTACSEDDKKSPVQVDEGIFINEIYASTGDDWIELFNQTDTERDISGYFIFDDETKKYALPSGTMIPPGGFLVLFCDDLATGLHTNFKLASTGETISLENAAGDLVDRVTFPILSDGQVYARFPDGANKWGISGISTQSLSNGQFQAPIIQKVDRTPLVPGLSDDVAIEAEVLSTTGSSVVALHYQVNNGNFVEVPMVANGTIYSATIPALNSTGTIRYYITAAVNGVTSSHPFDAPASAHEYILNSDPLPNLKINEFMAFNSACCPDDDGDISEFDDWIEIYNGGPTAVNIGGMYISDNKTDPFKNRISSTDPALTTIAPGGFIVLWADEQGSQGILHSNFKLSADGEDVALFYLDGRMIHSYSFSAQQENKSTGLSTNGGTSWQVFSSPTPGQSNE